MSFGAVAGAESGVIFGRDLIMGSQSSAVIAAAVRTPIGAFGGSLKDHAPTALASACVAEVLARSGVDARRVEQVVFGNVIHTEPRDMYLARVAGVEGGVPSDAPALTLNRLCGSGLQAVVTAAQAVILGDADCVVAGGAEVMSRAPHASQALRWGNRMGDVSVADMMTGALTDPFGHGHMGVTAENVAERFQVRREEQDALAVESHRRAARASSEGRFADQIVPIAGRRGGERIRFSHDEHVRADATLEAMSALRPAFRKGGSVTAGNASGINDGAAAVLVTSEACAVRESLMPLARIVGYAHAGVDPSEMGMGPVPAVQRLLERTGLKVHEFDVIEANEAFAAQACAVAKELGLDPSKTNPNGGAIALGHPIGATGAVLVVKLVHELRRSGGRYGLATMCIGGGQGIALAVEALR